MGVDYHSWGDAWRLWTKTPRSCGEEDVRGCSKKSVGHQFYSSENCLPSTREAFVWTLFIVLEVCKTYSLFFMLGEGSWTWHTGFYMENLHLQNK